MSPDISERSFEEAIESGLLQYGPDASTSGLSVDVVLFLGLSAASSRTGPARFASPSDVSAVSADTACIAPGCPRSFQHLVFDSTGASSTKSLSCDVSSPAMSLDPAFPRSPNSPLDLAAQAAGGRCGRGRGARRLTARGESPAPHRGRCARLARRDPPPPRLRRGLAEVRGCESVRRTKVDEREYREYLSEEQSASAKASARPRHSPVAFAPGDGGRCQAGCSAGRMQPDSCHGLLTHEHQSTFLLKPHYQLEGLTVSLRPVSKRPSEKSA